MTEPLEHELVVLFREQANSAEVPPVQVDTLRRRAAEIARDSHKPMILGVAAATALLVAGVAVSSGLLGSSPDETPATPPVANQGSSDGSLPQVPFINEGVLHVGSGEFPTSADQLFAEGDALLLTDTYYSQTKGESSRSFALTDGKIVNLPELVDAIVSLSPDGTAVAAITHPTPASTQVSVYRFPQMDQVRSIDLPFGGSCCGPQSVNFRGWDGAGHLFLNAEGESLMWDPASDAAVKVTGAPGEIVQADNAGVLAVPGEYGQVADRVLGEVNDEGHFQARLTITAGDPTAGVSWSPSGTLAAYFGQSAPVIDDVEDDREAVSLNLGGREFSHFVAFESDASVLLVARKGNKNDLLRCGAEGGCDFVLQIGAVANLDDWIFPR